MKVTAEQLINFVANHGDEYGVAMKDVELVGIDKCVKGANACNAAHAPGPTSDGIFSCYFSRNFLCHLNEAIWKRDAEYIVEFAEFDFPGDLMGGGTIYCNSYEELQEELEFLSNEYGTGFDVYDKMGNLVSRHEPVFRFCEDFV